MTNRSGFITSTAQSSCYDCCKQGFAAAHAINWPALACIVWLTPFVFPQVQRLEGALAAGASASVEGTIQNVTYKDEKSGYTVLKVAALHTAGAPPEQRRSAAQRQSRPINGTLSSPWHPI